MDQASTQTLDQFVQRMREAADANLESIILYGSAVSGDFHPEFSNLNVFCVLRDTSFSALQKLEPVARWWARQKQPPPLLMTREELRRSTDVFTIELLDMRQHHRVLFGNDVVQGLEIPMNLHRIQLEYELREKLVLLRQGVVLAAHKEADIWKLLLRSVPSFVTLFRHAVIALGLATPKDKRDALGGLSAKVGFDPAVLYQLLEIRENKSKHKQFEVKKLFADYLAIIEQVTAAVDKMLDSGSSIVS